MPLTGSDAILKATLKATIQSGLDAEFGTDHGFAANHEKMANVISDIAADIISHITANALIAGSGTTAVASGSSAGVWPTTVTTGTIS